MAPAIGDELGDERRRRCGRAGWLPIWHLVTKVTQGVRPREHRIVCSGQNPRRGRAPKARPDVRASELFHAAQRELLQLIEALLSAVVAEVPDVVQVLNDRALRAVAAPPDTNDRTLERIRAADHDSLGHFEIHVRAERSI